MFVTISSLILFLNATIASNIEDTHHLPEIEEKNIPAIEITISVEENVKHYFSDIPILAKVAFCESTFRHYDENGDVIRGDVDSRDVGVMQINEYYHGSQARKIGIDLTTLDGNMKFARLLYNDQGLAPWSASKPCWSKTIAMK